MTLPIRALLLALPLTLLACASEGDGDDTESADTGEGSGGTNGGGNGTNGANGGNGGNGGGGGHAADCAGEHSGTYDVDAYPVSGGVLGELLADGTLYVTFTSSSGDTDAEGFVAADGTMSGTHEGVTISGSYDFGSCSGSGTWTDQSLGGEGGTYELSLD